MGRTRTTEFKDLPKGLYFNKRSKCFYLRTKTNGDVRMGLSLSEALRNYYAHQSINYHCGGMSDLIDRYIIEVSPTMAKSTHESNIKAAKFLRRAFSGFQPQFVQHRHIKQYLNHRKEKAPVRGNREISLLCSIMRFAHDEGIINDYPFGKIKFNKETPRKRSINISELKEFIEYCPKWLKLYIRLKAMTGLRQGDLIELSSENLTNAGLLVTTNKTNKAQIFPVNDCLSDVIEELRTLNGYTKRGARKIRWYFFPSRQGGHLTAEGIRTQWGKSMRNAIKAGVFTEESRFQERDIRAFTASQCETLEQARLLLGHSGDHVTQKHYRREAEVTPVVGQNDKYLSTSN